jgi:hypothetical protein
LRAEGPGTEPGMSTTLIIGIVVAAAIVLLAIGFSVVGRKRRLEKRRDEAAGLREQAQIRARSAKQAELAAEEHAEKAKRERQAAEEHAGRAREVDPDVDDDSDRDHEGDRQDIAAR